MINDVLFPLQEIFDKLDSNQDGQLTKDELTTEIRFDQNNDGMVNEEEAEFYMSGNESYQRDSFIDNGWPLMKPALSDEEVADNTDSSDSKPEFNDDEDDHVDTDIDDEEEEEEEDYEDDEEAPHVRQPPPDQEDIAEEGNNKKYTFNRGRLFIICCINMTENFLKIL